MVRDQDFGIVRVRAFGTYDFRIVDPPKFLKEVAGTDDHFRLDEFADVMRSRIVSVFSEALAASKMPVLDIATRYCELGDALLPLINPAAQGKVRPRDGELRRRKRLGAAGGRSGDRQAFEHGRGRQSERLREIPDGAGTRKGRRRAPAESAPRWRSGMAMAQQMMNQPGGITAQATPAAGARRCGRAAFRKSLSPADAAKALGVSEADVIASLESGDLKGKNIGTQWRITRRRSHSCS